MLTVYEKLYCSGRSLSPAKLTHGHRKTIDRPCSTGALVNREDALEAEASDPDLLGYHQPHRWYRGVQAAHTLFRRGTDPGGRPEDPGEICYVDGEYGCTGPIGHH